MSTIEHDSEQGTGSLHATHVLEFPGGYTRSTGPVLGAFFTALRDQRQLKGIRDASGRVIAPPQEYDPETAATLTTDDLVDIGPGGEVLAWSWNPEPRAQQPLDHPFAWALVRFDGADTAMLVPLDAPREAVRTGLRVTAAFTDEFASGIDAVRVVPEEGAPPIGAPVVGEKPIRWIPAPSRLEYRYTPGREGSRSLRASAQGILLGRRCPSCQKVYFPARGACSMCGVAFAEDVHLADTGTVVTFAIINVSAHDIPLPYASAEVLLDGSDTTTMFLLQGIPVEDVRLGMRVKAVWKPREEWELSHGNITHVEPIDEPDVPFEQIEEYV